MTLFDALLAPAPISLPPGFAGFAAEPGRGAFDCARRVADREGAGTFVLAEPGPVLDMAVVLEPAEALRSARRALHLGAVALVEAVGSHAPPEIPVTIAWPDTLVFNGARLGGVRLGWPDEADPAHVPDWLVL
ncbi:MAG: hypothetical protein JO048_16275, partial [Methylobacteriaceae bacterium]|nr:hypothetical protein [Methylobacteriaceae bacterium]